MKIFDNTPESYITRAYPPLRILILLGFALAIGASNHFSTVLLGSIFSFSLMFLSKLPLQSFWKKMGEVNIFVLLLLLFVPISIPGTVLFSIGFIEWSEEGLLFALLISLKANIIFVSVLSLIGTLDAIELGHALQKLKVSPKFIQVFFFTVRYIEVVHLEYQRLRNAMKIRGFQPSCNSHSLKMIGYLLGCLLIRGFNRSERILQSMKCRGYNGTFHTLYESHWQSKDLVFTIVSILCIAFTLTWELSVRNG